MCPGNDTSYSFSGIKLYHQGPEHSIEVGRANAQPSLCTLPMFHPCMDTEKAPAGLGYVSNDGHHFACRNPAAENGHLEAVRALRDDSVRIDFANQAGFARLDTVTEILADEADGMLASHAYDNPSFEPTQTTASPLLLRHYNSESLTLPSHTSLLPTPNPTDALSSSVREISRTRDDPAKAAQLQPTISRTRAAPRPTTGASTRLPAASIGGFAAPTTRVPALLPFASLAPSRSCSPATFPGRVGGHRPDGEGALTPASSWWNNLKSKRTIPIEKAEGYTHTRSVSPLLSACFIDTYTLQRAIEAISGTLGTAASIGHEVLFTGVGLLQFAPVPGLDVAGSILLNIWDAIEMVEVSVMGTPVLAPLVLIANLSRRIVKRLCA